MSGTSVTRKTTVTGSGTRRSPFVAEWQGGEIVEVDADQRRDQQQLRPLARVAQEHRDVLREKTARDSRQRPHEDREPARQWPLAGAGAHAAGLGARPRGQEDALQ